MVKVKNIVEYNRFLKTRRVLSTSQYESQFGVDLNTNNTKVSVYAKGLYIMHTGSKFLLELDKSSRLFDKRENAEVELWNSFQD